MAKYIINEQWYLGKKDNIADEAERIVVTAAKIVRDAIREKQYNVHAYPTNEDIKNNDQGNDWVPYYLQTFLKMLGLPELKQNSIGQCIIQAARPRSVITPILFGLGIEMDHVFGSKWLINELAQLGFSITYDEVIRYKQSVIQSENLLTAYPPDTFTQWVADNVDHNVATLDGRGTFHGMGIIAISTAKYHTPLKVQSRTISRQQYTKVIVLVKDKGVPVVKYVELLEKGLSSVIYKPTVQLQFHIPCHQTCALICYGILDGCLATKQSQDQTGQVLCSIYILTIMNRVRLQILKYFFCQSLIYVHLMKPAFIQP